MKVILLGLSLASLSVTFTSQLKAQNITAARPAIATATSGQHISEEEFIPINGLQQWITIKGDPSKPVILFLHGGPGSVLTPYADHLYKDWEKDFVIANWDQRGAGRTFGQQAPEELTPAYLQANPLTVDQIAADGIQVAEYLIKHLNKRKVILFGTSWGSLLGLTMATKRPDLFYAYVGHSQIISPDDDLSLYNQVYKMAQQDHDQQSLKVLDELGLPPYDKARNVGKLFRIVKKYERAHAEPAPADWFTEATGYDNAKDKFDRELGDDYSFVHFVGDKQLGVKSMRATVNFMQSSTHLKLPVYIMQGEHDLLTPKEKTTAYFNKLQAPKKQFFLMPTAAHGFNQEVVDTQYKIFKSIKAL